MAQGWLVEGWLVVILAVVLLAAIIVSHLRSEKKRRQRIEAQFGERPEQDDEISRIAVYWKKRVVHDPAKHYIDDMTWDDLDMNKVFALLDACQSSVGASQLYALLHEPCFDSGVLAQREKLMGMLDANPAMRLKLQVLFAKMGRPSANSLASLVYDVSEKRIKRPWVFAVLSVIPILFIGVIFLNAYVGAFLLAASVITNGVTYYRTFRRIETELEAVKQFSALLWCAGKIVETHGLDEFALGRDIAQGYTLFKHLGGNLSGLTQQKVSELDAIMEYIRAIFLTNIRSYNRVIKALDEHTEAFGRLYRSVGELDAVIAVLSFRKSLPYFCRPEFISETRVEMDGVYHPLIEKPVENSFEMARGCLISGSNASGKSTFIKAVAISAILAQTVNTCLSRKAAMRRALVMTSMAVRDNVTAGDSYFITEIKSLRRIMDKLSEIFCICFIDEILKGTNTAERIAASASTLKYLHGRNCLCTAATHDVELTRMLADEYDNYHFAETVTDEGIVFSYKIQPGPTRTRNAIRLLEFMGFDERIIREAQRLAEDFSSTGKWPDRVSMPQS